jgi:multidrug efflux pump subunit AcrB
LQEQYFVILIRHLEELTSSQFGPILGQVVSMVPGLILIASRVFWGGWSLAITDGLLAPTVRTLIVTPASYVVRFHGKERDTGNGMMV